MNQTKKYVEGIRKALRKRAAKEGYSSIEGVVVSGKKTKGMTDE